MSTECCSISRYLPLTTGWRDSGEEVLGNGDVASVSDVVDLSWSSLLGLESKLERATNKFVVLERCRMLQNHQHSDRKCQSKWKRPPMYVLLRSGR